MTVAELIEHLQQYPDATEIGVLFWACSEPVLMDLDDIIFYKATDCPDSNRSLSSTRRYVKRNGQVMRYDPKTWDPSDGEPKFIDVLLFPGN